MLGFDAGFSGADATVSTGGCVAGTQSSCACPGLGATGVQVCDGNGQSFGPCTQCGAGDSGPSSMGGGDALNEADVDTGDGAAPEAGPPDAGGPVCDPPDGGLPCDPGHVQCAGSTCATATTFCCETSTGSSGMCDPAKATCTQSESHCDEALDCDGGVCCMSITISFATTVKSTCQATCPTGSYQLCRSNTECGAGKACVVQTCISGNDTEACSTVPGCTPK